MKKLLASESKPDMEFCDSGDVKRRTCLLLAVGCGDIETVTLLLSHGASSETKDKSGTTPLMLAASLRKHLIVKELLKRDASVEARDKKQKTALHLAIHNSSPTSSNYEVVVLLIDSVGSDQCRQANMVNAADKSGKTPLHYCAELGMLDEAKLLLRHGALFEAQDVAKMTPIYYAIKFRKYYIVKELLLKYSPDTTPQRPSEPTSAEIEKLLKNKGYRWPKLQNSRSRRKSSAVNSILAGQYEIFK